MKNIWMCRELRVWDVCLEYGMSRRWIYGGGMGDIGMVLGMIIEGCMGMRVMEYNGMMADDVGDGAW